MPSCILPIALFAPGSLMEAIGFYNFIIGTIVYFGGGISILIIACRKNEKGGFLMKKAILEICHVSKSFRHQSILSDGNMTFYEGELLYLCGKNGSGKSTIFKIIAGLLEPGHWYIELDEKGENRWR